MKFRPLHDRVVVKRIDAEEKTAGGIIIPDTAKEKPSQGQVVGVGPGAVRPPFREHPPRRVVHHLDRRAARAGHLPDRLDRVDGVSAVDRNADLLAELLEQCAVVVFQFGTVAGCEVSSVLIAASAATGSASGASS